MRKILLASTALVAMTSVSAMAADVTISGSFEFGYQNTSQNDPYADTAGRASNTPTNTVSAVGQRSFVDANMKNGSRFYTQNDVNIKFSETTDSGLTMSFNFGLDEESSTGTNNQDDMIFEVSGDFGRLNITGENDDSVLDAIDIEAAYTKDEGSTSHTRASSGINSVAGEASGGLASGTVVTYYLPEMVTGLTAGMSMSNGGFNSKGDVTEYGIKYATGTDGVDVTVNWGTADEGNNGAPATDTAVDDAGIQTTAYGIQVAAMGVTFGYQATEFDNKDTANDYQAQALGVKYTLGNMPVTLAAALENLDADFEPGAGVSGDFERTSYSATYAIASGLSASITTSSSEEKVGGQEADQDDVMTFAINASF